MTNIELEKEALASVLPFENEQAISIQDLEIEMQSDSVSMRGSLDITLDRESLQRAEMLGNLFLAIASKMKNMKLADTAEGLKRETNANVNKFGRAFD